MKTRPSLRFEPLLAAALLAGAAGCLLMPGSTLIAVASDQASKTPPGPMAGSESRSEAFVGLQPGLGSLPLLGRGRKRSISAENPNGEKGRGGMAIPNPSEPKPAASARAADNLGQGWKVRPFIRLNARETATLMDVAGSGIIQHIWLVEGLNRGLVIRFYWDGEETPSVEAPAPDFFAVGHGRFAAVNSLAVVVNPANAMNCFWPMPFRSRARITLSNETAQDVQLVAYQITYVETEIPAAAGTFHAQYRRASTSERNPYTMPCYTIPNNFILQKLFQFDKVGIPKCVVKSGSKFSLIFNTFSIGLVDLIN